MSTETKIVHTDSAKETFETILKLFTDNGYEVEQVVLTNKTINNNIIVTLFGTRKEDGQDVTETIFVLISKDGIAASDTISRFDASLSEYEDNRDAVRKVKELGLFLTDKAGMKVDLLTHLIALSKLIDFNQNFVTTDEYDFASDKHTIVPYDSLDYAVTDDVMEELSEVLPFTTVIHKREVLLRDTPLATGVDENGKVYRYQIITNDGETCGTPLETIGSAKAWCLDMANNDELMQELCPDTDIETIKFITIVETTDY